ncbi:TetR/AcrR family transcriptional regulator [Lysinibacillus sp. KU-BSD001]|uniref:TetR/AcrR family transcriptional regulator n=1 Tax=Lysinibacillus sp. KU-BSD001 TaxID=3141328 RepID=UPI0036E30C82
MARERKFSTTEIFRETERLLLTVGYEGYNISLLAEALNVSRAAIYKYYTNKEELVVDFMLEHIQQMIQQFAAVDHEQAFEHQLDEVLDIILASKDLHRIFSMAHVIEPKGKQEIVDKMEHLSRLHQDMYAPLQAMVNKGKEEGVVDDTIPNALIIAFVFQSIDLPNYMNVPDEVFLPALKKLVKTGIYKGA